MGSVAGRDGEPERMKKLLERLGRFLSARRRSAHGPTVGVGTVRAIAGGRRQVFVEVVAVSGETFIGRLARCESDPDLSVLRPGLVVLVAFDPAAREKLSLPTDAQAVLAVRASWLATV
ncbi:MAG: hypothetical protein ACLQIK_16810 [Mycobacterium sp.]|uniref:hypothetical protein n=1 Tax=Mycobacterium sp. TaxID=1785 RepID=UPI002B929C57|nr:hypothetical protein [Mycobacterium sp.]